MAKYTLLFVLTIVVVALAVSAQQQNPDNRMEMGDNKKVFCTKEWSPVCASNGKTYGNKCEFENAKGNQQDLTFRTGACDEPIIN